MACFLFGANDDLILQSHMTLLCLHEFELNKICNVEKRVS